MDYFNNFGSQFTIEYNSKSYRFIPGINKNLPNGLKEVTNGKLLPLWQEENTDVIGQVETNKVEEVITNVEDIEQNLKEAKLLKEYEEKKSAILLSDKTDRSKKIALNKLEREYNA